MVGFDIGNDRDHWLQMQERGVALVRLGNQITTGAQASIGTRTVEQAADDEGRIPFGFGIDARNQTGGGGLAMGTGNRDPMTITHQLSQHLGATHDRDALLTGRHHLGIVALDRRRHHDHTGTRHMAGLMADEDGGPQLAQPLSHRIGRNVRA